MSTNDEPTAPFLRHIASVIATHGYAVIPVGYGECSAPDCCGPRSPHPWTYTVGLAHTGQPELVLMGLEPAPAHFAISWVADEGRSGRPVPADEPFMLAGVGVKVVDVPAEWLLADLDRMAMWFNHFEALGASMALPTIRQVVWADVAGRFPDDPLCDGRVLRHQPILRSAPLRYPEPSTDAARRARRHGRRTA